jgi:hypothetical protein
MRTVSPITAGQDQICSVCNEIGERLGQMLRIDAILPAGLDDLLTRLSKLDRDTASFIEDKGQRESPPLMRRAA